VTLSGLKLKGYPPKASCGIEVIMARIPDFKEEHQPQDWERLTISLRTRTSIGIGLAAIVGWFLSQRSHKKRRTNAHESVDGANQHLGKLTLVSTQNQPKSAGGLFSLALELLGAVAIRLLQRYFKTWSSTLFVALKDRESPGYESLPGKNPPKDFDHRPGFEISPGTIEGGKPYEKGIVALFKNTASEWIQDKCPQLGAALAYFTVFSLAPLVLVLLAVFGLIFGGSDQARQKNH
jgi:hypothetical protein